MYWFCSKPVARSLLAIVACLLVLLSGTTPSAVQALPPPALFKAKPAKPKPLFKPSQSKPAKPTTPKKLVTDAAAGDSPIEPDKSKAKDAPKIEPPKVFVPAFPTLRPPEEIRGVWLTNNDVDVLHDRTKLTAAMGKLAELKFNTIYPVIWNSGYVTYPSQVAQTAGIQPFVYRGHDGQDVIADV
jgi:hypothetical protein